MDYAATILAKIPGTSSRRDRGLRQLFEMLEAYMPAEQIEQVMHAYEYSADAHQGQTRMSGEPFISRNATVVALREIADGHITPSILEEVEQPATEEFMQPEAADELIPMRGISIGD